MARGELYLPLSVDYADDPKIIAAGEKPELLYIRASCLAKRTLSDGFVADVQLARFGLPGVQARARRLVEVGLWTRVDGGYQILAFLKRNKSRAQVEAQGKAESESGSRGNHLRWHVRQGRASPDCQWCQSDRVPDRPPDGDPDRDTRVAPESTETETETETETTPDRFPDPHPMSVDNPEHGIEEAIELAAYRYAHNQLAKGRGDNVDGLATWWLTTHGEKARQRAIDLLETHELTLTQLADALLNPNARWLTHHRRPQPQPTP